MKTMRFIRIDGVSREAQKIIKRTIKAYRKFKFISDFKKANHGYYFSISDERFDLFKHEIEVSLIEAGLA